MKSYKLKELGIFSRTALPTEQGVVIDPVMGRAWARGAASYLLLKDEGVKAFAYPVFLDALTVRSFLSHHHTVTLTCAASANEGPMLWLSSGRRKPYLAQEPKVSSPIGYLDPHTYAPKEMALPLTLNLRALAAAQQVANNLAGRPIQSYMEAIGVETNTVYRVVWPELPGLVLILEPDEASDVCMIGVDR